MTFLIKRNITVRCKKSETSSTYSDNQPMCPSRYEGECKTTGGSNLLGKFELPGIPPAPRGVPQTEVVFDIDASAFLNVSASENQTASRSPTTGVPCQG